MNGVLLALGSMSLLAAAPSVLPAGRGEGSANARQTGLGLLLLAGAGAMLYRARSTRAATETTGAPMWPLSDKGASSAPPSRAPSVPASSALPAGVVAKSGVVWSEPSRAFVARMRAFLPPEVPMIVNSVTRTPESQAAAMVTKYQYAESRQPGGGAADIRATYGTKAEAFLSVPVTVESWARVVRSLYESGRGFQDGHLKGTAVDLHIKTLPSAHVPLLVDAARRAGGSPTVEQNPPHLHIDGLDRRTA